MPPTSAWAARAARFERRRRNDVGACGRVSGAGSSGSWSNAASLWLGERVRDGRARADGPVTEDRKGWPTAEVHGHDADEARSGVGDRRLDELREAAGTDAHLMRYVLTRRARTARSMRSPRRCRTYSGVQRADILPNGQMHCLARPIGAKTRHHGRSQV